MDFLPTFTTGLIIVRHLKQLAVTLCFDQTFTLSLIDLDQNVQLWLKHRVATLCFYHLTKASPVEKVACKTVKN